jgi:hypothetical protein
MRILLATVALLVVLPGASQADVLINNGLDCSNAGNVINDNIHPNDYVYVRNVGCGMPIPWDPCASPGDATEVCLVDGGAVLDLLTQDSSTITVSGGTVRILGAADSSTITMSGGTASRFVASDSSTIMIVGSGFAVDGVPVPYGDLAADSGTLTGTLASGDPIDSIFYRGSLGFPVPGTIVLIPAEAIDVQPGDPENRILGKPHVPVLVAILGSAEVDVRDVDVTTMAFGPGEASPALDLTRPFIYRLSLRDVNGDDEDDLVATFSYEQTELPFGESEACLTAEIASVPFEGCDTVLVFPPGCGRGFELALLLPPLVWLRRRRNAA